MIEVDFVGIRIPTTFGTLVAWTNLPARGFGLLVLVIWPVAPTRALISPNQSIVIISAGRAMIKASKIHFS